MIMATSTPSTHRRRIRSARPPLGAALAALLLGAAVLPAQSIEQRITAVRDGTVRLAYASRPDACGETSDGQRSVALSSWFGSRGDADETEICASGPVRVTLRRADGRTVGLRVQVGGRWATDDGVVDLGTIGAADAARYFLGQVTTLDGRQADRALDAAAFADSIDLTAELKRLAVDRDLRSDTRMRAVFWLASYDAPAARRAVRDLVADASLDENVRGAAIIALSREITDDDVRFLREQYPSLPARLRDETFLAVSRSDSPLARSWLSDVATSADEPEHAREQALFWLGHSDAPTSFLVSLYPKLGTTAMRRQYTFVLSQRGDAEALDALIAVARNDSDREVQRQALFWIGRSHDPRAVRFLEQMVTR